MGEQLFLERFIWFDNAIRNKRWPNARSLSEQFEISEKTAQRSIEYFRDRLGAPLEYDYTRKGYYYTEADFKLPLANISEEELLALMISRKLISEASAGLLGKELGPISQKLGFLLAASLPGRSRPEDAFSFRLKGFTPTDPTVFKTVTAALMQCRQLTFNYCARTASLAGTRTVEPHHMVNYMGNWHLIAFCHLRDNWRDFLLGRMTDCRVETEPFEVRANEAWQPFLQNTFGIFQTGKKYDVVLRFAPACSLRIQEEIWHEQQSEYFEETGALVRSIPVSHDMEIMMEILRHGAQVEVLAPASLRERVAEELRAAVGIYEAVEEGRGVEM